MLLPCLGSVDAHAEGGQWATFGVITGIVVSRKYAEAMILSLDPAKVQPDIYISNAGTHGPNPDRFFAAVKYIMEYQPRVVILEDLVAACRQDPLGIDGKIIVGLTEHSTSQLHDARYPERLHRWRNCRVLLLMTGPAGESSSRFYPGSS